MREVLFRGKRIDNGQWVEGYYVKFEQLPNSCIYYVYEGNTLVTDIDPEIVCQYTGLTDKNGTKIFEGDILRFENCSNYLVFWDSDYCAFGSCWYSDFDHLSKYRNVEIEVVGNIFDNPELLEDEG